MKRTSLFPRWVRMVFLVAVAGLLAIMLPEPLSGPRTAAAQSPTIDCRSSALGNRLSVDAEHSGLGFRDPEKKVVASVVCNYVVKGSTDKDRHSGMAVTVEFNCKTQIEQSWQSKTASKRRNERSRSDAMLLLREMGNYTGYAGDFTVQEKMFLRTDTLSIATVVVLTDFKENSTDRVNFSANDAQALAHQLAGRYQATAKEMGCTDEGDQPAKYDLTVSNLEVVQVVQDPGNTVPLVARKGTVARVFVKLGSGPLKPLEGVSARLRGYRDGKEFTDSPLEPWNKSITVPNVSQRENIDHSLNFRLPDDWTEAATLILIAEVMPPKGVEETNSKNNDKTVQVSFSYRRTLTISYLPVCYQTASNCPSGNIATMGTWMAKIFPVSDVGFEYEQLPVDKWVWDRSNLSTEAGDKVFLAALRQRYELTERSDHYRKQLMAWLPEVSGLVAGGESDPVWFGSDGRISWQQDYSGHSPYFAPFVPAHEVGHNLGLRHTNTEDGCSATGRDKNTDWPYKSGTVQEVGFDVEGKRVIPASYFDVMTYCGFDGSNIWISPHHYRKLYDGNFVPQGRQLGRTAASLLDLQEGDTIGDVVLAAQDSARDYLVITGTAKRDGSAGTIGSVYRISSSIPAEPSRRNGNHCVRITGGAQTDYCFDLSFQGHTTGAAIDEDAFTVRVPVAPGTTKVALRRGNRELASRTATKNAPAVTIASPKPGDSWNGSRTVEWTATDADNDPLNYAVQYSPDGGRSWYPLAVDATDPRHTVDSKALAPGNQVYVRVLASDGLNTVVEQSGPFTIQDQRSSGSSSTLLYLLLGAGAAGAAAGGGALAAAGRRRSARRRTAALVDPTQYPVGPAFQAAAPDTTTAHAPARLLVIQGQTNARWLDLTMPVAGLGRGGGTTLQLQDAAASRHHARLSWTEQGWLLEDLQSRNGTYVNGERITSRLLHPGDQIQICSIVMQFQSPSA
jgi:hypothetical protein